MHKYLVLTWQRLLSSSVSSVRPSMMTDCRLTRESSAPASTRLLLLLELATDSARPLSPVSSTSPSPTCYSSSTI